MANDLQTQGDAPAVSLQQPSAATDAAFAAARSERLYPNEQPKPEGSRPPQTEQAKSPVKVHNDESQQTQPKPADSDFQLQLPEGVQLDQQLLNSAAPVFKELGLSSENASKLVPLVTEVQTRFQQTQLDQFSALTKSWAKEAQADQDMGGQNWKETSRLAGVALQAGGAAASNHEVRQLLDQSGLGNHPAMIRFFRDIGRVVERMKPNGSSRRLSVIEAARQAHQKAVYPNDPPERWSSFQQKIESSRRR